jgi:hypothetical protein
VKSYEKLMRHIAKFEIIGEDALFLIKGMPEIKLKMKESCTNCALSCSDKLPFH